MYITTSDNLNISSLTADENIADNETGALNIFNTNII